MCSLANIPFVAFLTNWVPGKARLKYTSLKKAFDSKVK